MFIRKRRKVLCYVIIYDQVDIIKKSLNFLTNQADELDIVIIENSSANTPEIRSFVNSLGKKGLIRRYYLFNENITNNAYDVVLHKEISTIHHSRYVLITDGDVTCNKTSWLNEEISIINNNRDVFACGATLDMSNLPTKTFPNAIHWVPADMSQHDDYYETLTGVHLLLLRGRDLSTFLSWQRANDKKFVDGTMHEYTYKIVGKKWARTKESTAYHLTWDLYANKSHPYTKMKTTKSFSDIWNHDQSSSFTLTNFS